MTIQEKEHDYKVKLNCFVLFSVTMAFAIVWSILGESAMKIAFSAVAFALFLMSAVELEMSSRTLHGVDAH